MSRAATGSSKSAEPPPPDPLAPARLNRLSLRNRIIKTATYEGMSPGGRVGEALIEHHGRLAEGGVGLSTVAYCAVAEDGRTFPEQLLMCEENIAPLTRLTEAVHAHGGAASIQLGHCGGFSRDVQLRGRGPRGPSRAPNPYGFTSGLFWTRAMSHGDIEALLDAFSLAARRAVSAGFDAIELHMGHGYLLSQFLSPASNRRNDRYGGTLRKRMRLPVHVLRRVREVVGPDFPLLAKINLRDGFRGGLELDETIAIAARLEQEGIDALVLSGGFVDRNAFFLLRGERPLLGMIRVEHSWLQRAVLATFGPWLIKPWPYRDMYFLEDARQLRPHVRVPLVLLGGIVSGAHLTRAMAEGFDFVAMGRALISNPNLVRELAEDPSARARCDHCNQCMVEMERPGGVRCVLPEGDAFPR